MKAALFAVIAVSLLALSPLALAMESDAEEPPDFSMEYGYVMEFNADNINITGVTKVAKDGTGKAIYSGTNTSAISDEWSFDPITGVGPFNCFYAALNINANEKDSTCPDEKIESTKGGIAYVLDPHDLKKNIQGHAFNPAKYNIMLVIPTIYWYSDANADGSGKLYLSNKADYSGFDADIRSNMKAYAHELKFPGRSDTVIAPYIALGVYETGGNTSSDSLVSQTGKTPAIGSSSTLEGYYKVIDKMNTDVPGGQYMIWNYYQWTMYKMMSYAILGNKDVSKVTTLKVTRAGGNVTTGLTDAKGPYSTTTNSSSNSGSTKVLLENPFGSLWDMVGGVYTINSTVYAENNVRPSSSPSATTGAPIADAVMYASNGTAFNKTYSGSTSWDIPKLSGTPKSSTDSLAPKSWTAINGSVHLLSVGGRVSSNDSAYAKPLFGNWGGEKTSIDGIRTLRLAYALEGFQITYDHGAGSGDAPVDDAHYAPGSAATLKLQGDMVSPSADRKFVGWEYHGIVYADGGSFTLPMHNVTMVARWEDPYATLQFDGSGGEGVMDDQRVGNGIQTKIKKNAFSKEGYTFLEWEGSDGKVYGNEEILNLELHSRISIKLTAVWEGFYTVSYDAAGGSSAAPSSFTQGSGTIFLVDGYDGHRNGYTFEGWSDGTKIYQPGDRYTIGHSDIVLKAVWKEKAHFEEEDEDDIFRLLNDGRISQSDSGLDFKWIVVAIASVALAVSAVMVVAVLKRRGDSPLTFI